MFKHISLEKKDSLAIVTLDRPDALNAFNQAMATELRCSIDMIDCDQTIRAVLLKGNGKYFCAGGDVGWFHELSQEDTVARQHAFNSLIDTVHAVIESIVSLRVPVVAAVQGGAAGFGISLMAACDFILTSPHNTFNLAYLNLGAPTDGGATWILPRLMGMCRARELILLSEPFDGVQALSFDLVNRLVSPEELNDESIQLARRLASGPTQAYGHIKQLLAFTFQKSLPEQLQLEQRAFLKDAETQDFSEGLNAFIERRKAEFKGI